MQVPLFIVSTGRCGSTMLSRLLAHHPDVASFSELFNSLFPWAFTKSAVNGANFWPVLNDPRPHTKVLLTLIERGITIDEFRYPVAKVSKFQRSGIPPLLAMTLPELTQDPDGLNEELGRFVQALPMDHLGIQYERVFDWLTRRTGRKLWVERSGASLSTIGALLHNFPNARYVHIYRDGRETAYSASRFHPMRLGQISRMVQAATKKHLYERFSDSDLARVPPELKSILAQNFDVDAFMKYQIPIERFGAMWSDMMTKGTPLLAKLPPDRLLNMRYESVLQHPETELRRLMDFLAPSLERETWLAKVVPLVRSNPLKWTTLPDEERSRLEAACAPGMKVLAELP